MTYRKYRRKPPPKRYCRCGAYVGRHYQPFVLCDPCRKEGLDEAERRTAERNERHGRIPTPPQPRLMDDIPY